MIRITAQVLLVLAICCLLSSQFQCEAGKTRHLFGSSCESNTSDDCKQVEEHVSSSSSNWDRVSLDKIGLLKNCVRGALLGGSSQNSGIDRMTMEMGVANFIRIDMDILYRRDFVPSNQEIEHTFLEKIALPCQKVLANGETWFQEAVEGASKDEYSAISTNEDKLLAEEICRNVVAEVSNNDYAKLRESLSALFDRIRANILFKQLGRFGAGKRIQEEIKSKLTIGGLETVRILAGEVQGCCRRLRLDPFQPNLPTSKVTEIIATTMMMFNYTAAKRADITDRESYAQHVRRLIAEPCQVVVDILRNWPQIERKNGSLEYAHADCLISEDICKRILSNLEKQIDLSYAEYLKMAD